MKKSLQVFYQTKKEYSMTINPDDKHQYYCQTDRLQKFKNFMYQELLSWDKHIKYQFTMELSEPRSNTNSAKLGPRLHLHGIIEFKSDKGIRHFLLHLLTQLCKYSIWDIDTIDDRQYWLKYCNKQQQIMRTGLLTNYMHKVDKSNIGDNEVILVPPTVTEKPIKQKENICFT